MTDVAVCLFDHARNPALTAPALKRHMIDALKADVFLYLPRYGATAKILEQVLQPVDTAADGHDWQQEDFAAALQPLTNTYLANIRSASGLAMALSPLACGDYRSRTCPSKNSSLHHPNAREANVRCCAMVLHIYRGQAQCLSMLHKAERRRGEPYRWVLPTRGDLMWLSEHPPLAALSTDRVWVPQCRNDWGGLYDRHAVIPRQWADVYLSRWHDLRNGSSSLLLTDAAAQDEVSFEVGIGSPRQRALWPRAQPGDIPRTSPTPPPRAARPVPVRCRARLLRTATPCRRLGGAPSASCSWCGHAPPRQSRVLFIRLLPRCERLVSLCRLLVQNVRRRGRVRRGPLRRRAGSVCARWQDVAPPQRHEARMSGRIALRTLDKRAALELTCWAKNPPVGVGL